MLTLCKSGRNFQVYGYLQKIAFPGCFIAAGQLRLCTAPPTCLVGAPLRNLLVDATDEPPPTATPARFFA